MNPYRKGTKIYDLCKKICDNEKLKYLMFSDQHLEYKCNNYTSKGFTHLHKCVVRTREYPFLNEYISEYLKCNPNKINIKNKLGFTPLILASLNSRSNSSEKTVKILLKYNADINAQDKNGKTALMHCCVYTTLFSTEETVKILLEHNANVNLKSIYGFTAIVYAVKNVKVTSTIKTISMLLEHNADVNIGDNDGRTALIHTVRYLRQETEEIVKMLLNHNADVNIQDRNIRSYCINVYPQLITF